MAVAFLPTTLRDSWVSCSKCMKNRIPALYKSNFENIGLYFFVEAQKQIVPAISIEQAIRNYCKFICSDEDMNNTDSLRVIYHRMKKKQFDAAKTVNKLD